MDSVAATVLWLLGSGLFSLYVNNFGKYNQTYGSLAAIVILLLWFYLSTYAVLVGAEFNAEAEHQARKESTSSERPLNNRNARIREYHRQQVINFPGTKEDC